MRFNVPYLVVVLSLGMLSGCFPLKQYREAALPRAGDCPEDTAPKQCAFILHEDAGKSPYTLGVVELDDQGVAHDVPQLEPFLKTIEREPAGYAGRIVLVFAHGWFHDARPGDSNLRFVRRMLEQFSAAEANAVAAGAQALPRRVVGVYIAWRGAAWRIPLLKYVTFWSRKDAAHRIGEREVTEMVIKIRQAAYRTEPAAPALAGERVQPPNRFVVMGHSFGAALVHSALSQLVANSLLTTPTDGAETLPLADAVMLFNPAFEAARMHHLFLDAAMMTRPRPVLTVLTADNDRATGWAFPAARWINNVFGSFRDDVPNPLRRGVIAERSANARTIGHYAPYLTHDMKLVSNAEATRKKWDPVARQTRSARGTPAERAVLHRDSEQALQDAITQHERDLPMTFGETRISPRKGLLHGQLSVFNITMDEDIWDGHSLEQDEARQKRILSFLMLYIPFSGATPRSESVPPPEIIELQPQPDASSPPGIAPGPKPQVAPPTKLSPASPSPRF